MAGIKRSVLSGFATFALSSGIAAVVGGCGWEKPKPLQDKQFNASQSAVIHVRPAELAKIIRQELPKSSLGLTIESAEDGNILTGWKTYEGTVHVLRVWAERTRFKINILPDFNDPLGTSHLEIFDETEEKPSDPQPWYPNPDLRRPDRAQEVLKAIEEEVGGRGTTQPDDAKS